MGGTATAVSTDLVSLAYREKESVFVIIFANFGWMSAKHGQ